MARKAPKVSLINAAAFMRASKLPGSTSFSIAIRQTKAHTVNADATPTDLTGIPKDYHEFTDVFSKGKADTLALH